MEQVPEWIGVGADTIDEMGEIETEVDQHGDRWRTDGVEVQIAASELGHSATEKAF